MVDGGTSVDSRVGTHPATSAEYPNFYGHSCDILPETLNPLVPSSILQSLHFFLPSAPTIPYDAASDDYNLS